MNFLIRGIAKTSFLTIGTLLAVKMVKRSLNCFHLANRIVLITGGSRGLGLILALKLADRGANVVICGRSGDTLTEASEKLSKKPGKHLAIPCDISDKQQVKQMIGQVRKEMGTVDVLINNAGIIQAGPMESMEEEDYKTVMGVHFWGPLHLIYEILPDMKKKKTGRIVNIASIGGKVSFPHLLPYNASKYALSGLSEGITSELKQYNIKVTTVYPGLMRTGSPRNIDVKGQHKKEYAWFKISDSLPFISMDANRAASQIIEAIIYGDKTVTLSLPAKIAATVHGVAPGLTISVFKLVNFLLPDKPKRRGSRTRKGYESESKISKSGITAKTDEAARRNLEKKAK